MGGLLWGGLKFKPPPPPPPPTPHPCCLRPAPMLQRFFWDTTFCGSSCFEPSTPIICEVRSLPEIRLLQNRLRARRPLPPPLPAPHRWLARRCPPLLACHHRTHPLPSSSQVTGEWTASGAPDGAIAELAQRLNALLCTLEHRNYGLSLVAPLSNKAAITGSLTVEQAIEDFAAFVPYFEAFLSAGGTAPSTAGLPSNSSSYTPAHRWVIVGGSACPRRCGLEVRAMVAFTRRWQHSGTRVAHLSATARRPSFQSPSQPCAPSFNARPPSCRLRGCARVVDQRALRQLADGDVGVVGRRAGHL